MAGGDYYYFRTKRRRLFETRRLFEEGDYNISNAARQKSCQIWTWALLSVPNLVPWLIFNVTDQFCCIRPYFSFVSRETKHFISIPPYPASPFPNPPSPPRPPPRLPGSFKISSFAPGPRMPAVTQYAAMDKLWVPGWGFVHSLNDLAVTHSTLKYCPSQWTIL